MTINNTWGFKRDDHNWKTTETLIRNLCDIARKGGNYLLNVGPTAEGVSPQPSLNRLADISRWMKVNGEAIYGTGPTPFGDEAGAFSETEKDRNGKQRCHRPAAEDGAGSDRVGGLPRNRGHDAEGCHEVIHNRSGARGRQHETVRG
jgi:alpha-L-fucosidase